MKSEENFFLSIFFSFDSFMIVIYIIWRGYYEFKPDASFFKGPTKIPVSETLSASWMNFNCRGVELFNVFQVQHGVVDNEEANNSNSNVNVNVDSNAILKQTSKINFDWESEIEKYLKMVASWCSREGLI